MKWRNGVTQRRLEGVAAKLWILKKRFIDKPCTQTGPIPTRASCIIIEASPLQVSFEDRSRNVCRTSGWTTYGRNSVSVQVWRNGHDSLTVQFEATDETRTTTVRLFLEGMYGLRLAALGCDRVLSSFSFNDCPLQFSRDESVRLRETRKVSTTLAEWKRFIDHAVSEDPCPTSKASHQSRSQSS